MRLRSGALYRSGNPIERDTHSKVSTEGSTARTQDTEPQQRGEDFRGYASDSNMDPTSSYHSQPIRVDYDYDGRLRFQGENTHGAKIYTDVIQRYVVKVEDHTSDFDPAPWVNYQEGIYMGSDGSMYVLTEHPEDVDRMGNLVRKDEIHVEENPPKIEQPDLRPINSVWVNRVLIDDNTKVLYKREDQGTEFFYLRDSPPDHTSTEEKVLYAFIRTQEGIFGDILFFDKYGLEWEMKLPSELKGITCHGMPIARQEKDLGGPSNFNLQTPGTFPVPPLNPIQEPTLRPMPSYPGMSFANIRPPVGPHEPRPTKTGFGIGLSGYPADQVPTPPLHTTSLHTSLTITGFRPPPGFMGASTKSQIRPSHLQKLMKKFSGASDPHDHLESYRQVVRAERVEDIHVIREGFGLTLEGKALSWFQTIDTRSYHDFDSLAKDFLGAFTKTGIKHSISSLITSFKQKDNESVRDCANRLRQYIARCPELELPSQEKSVSIFLEGLMDRNLHADLYRKKHKTLNECIADAIDLDDNCDIYGKDKAISGSDSLSAANSSDAGQAKIKDTEEMVEMIMQKMSQAFRPPQKPVRCEFCGGDHPSTQCLPKQDLQPYRAPSRTDKWCEFEGKWTNHEAHECYHKMRHLQAQTAVQPPLPQQPPQQRQGYAPQWRNLNNPVQAMEHARPALGNQPPLPGTAIVRYMQPNEEYHDGTIVPYNYYEEERIEQSSQQVMTTNYPSDSSTYVPEGKFRMDHNTLCFIASGMARPTGPQGPPPYKSGPSPSATPVVCFNCGENHWIKDCPYLRRENPQAQTSEVLPLPRFCLDCGDKHLITDCPMHPDRKGNSTLNYVGTLPSPNNTESSESDQVIPVQAITRAQAKNIKEKGKEKVETGNQTDVAPSTSSKKTKETWKQRRARRAASKKRKLEKEQAAQPQQTEGTNGNQTQGEPSQKRTNNETSDTKAQSAGSVLAEKLHEPLEALLKAFEARLKPQETIEERWNRYPDPALESRQLEIYKKLVETLQSIENHTRQLAKTRDEISIGPTPEPRPEYVENTTGESNRGEPSLQTQPSHQEQPTPPQMIPNSNIPEVEEEWGNKLWDAVKNMHEPTNENDKPPIVEIDFDQKTLELELRSDYNDEASESSERSKAGTLKTLPSFQGEYEPKSEIRKLPSQRLGKEPKLDIANLTALMSAPIRCTLPLADVLKVRPELWKELGQQLKKLGMDLPIAEMIPLPTEKRKRGDFEPVPLNKVGDYCEGEDENTTLPVEVNEIQTLAILDSGAGVAIATKKIWEVWGKPAIRKTRMKLQLADGHVEKPIGLLEKIIVSSCGVEYQHTFAIVDFGKNPNYDVILGRPFMRQLKMIQDWGFNYIYLRQPQAITRVNLGDHSYRDVARTPVEDFDSATATNETSRPSEANMESQLWMCNASESGSEKFVKEPVVEEDYILEPFPNDFFIPDAWQDMLATVDVCVNEVTPTAFCDEDGFDIAPLYMAKVIIEDEDELESEAESSSTTGLRLAHKVSLKDKNQNDAELSGEEHDPLDQVFYDASDEFEENQEKEPTKENEKAQAPKEAQQQRNKHLRNRQGLKKITMDKKPMQVNALQEEDQPIERRPYIRVEIGENHQPEVALVDTGADLNFVSYEAWVRINKPTLCITETTVRGFMGSLTPVEGYLELPVFLGFSNVKHRFYVMKPKQVYTQVILGRPWQRTYNAYPHWKREGILFEYDRIRRFAHFLTEDDYTTDSESEDEAEATKEEGMPKETTPTESEKTSQQNKKPEADKKTSQELEKQQDEQKREPSTQNIKGKAPPQQKVWPQANKQKAEGSITIWVPKKLAQAQNGSQKMWVPKQVVPQGPHHRRQPTKKPKKKTPRKAAAKQSRKTQKRVDYGQQIWLPKTLLSAQKDSKYKWVPKHLLKAIPPKQQKPRKQRKQQQPQQLAKSTSQKKWVPKKTLNNQGYYEGATHIWIPMQAKTQKQQKERPQPTAKAQETRAPKKVWVKKVVIPQQTEKQVAPTMPPSTKERATAQDKGKWVPKVAEPVTQDYKDVYIEDYIEELPGTSQQGNQVPTKEAVKEQGPNKPSTLDTTQHLSYMLKTFNSKQVIEYLKRAMEKNAGTKTSSANALGSHPLQDPSLAPH